MLRPLFLRTRVSRMMKIALSLVAFLVPLVAGSTAALAAPCKHVPEQGNTPDTTSAVIGLQISICQSRAETPGTPISRLVNVGWQHHWDIELAIWTFDLDKIRVEIVPA